MKQHEKSTQRIYTMSVARVYPFYVAKAEKKGRTKAEVDEIICWLTGYSQKELEAQLKTDVNFENFFKGTPKLNPARKLITGLICGIRVEEIKDPIVKSARQLDKLIDELAKARRWRKFCVVRSRHFPPSLKLWRASQVREYNQTY